MNLWDIFVRMKNIIIIVESSFSSRDYGRFGVSILLDKGYDVHVFDCTPMLCPKLPLSKMVGTVSDKFRHHYICNTTTFVDALLKIRGSVFALSYVQYRALSYKIYRVLSKYKINYGYIALPPVVMETIALNESDISTGYAFFKKICKINIKEQAVRRLPLSLLRLRSAKYVFYGSRLSNTNLKFIDRYTEKCCLHSFDYEVYKEDLEEDNRYYDDIVFLDQSLPIHPDFLRSPVDSMPPTEKYYDEMCSLFDQLEKNYGRNVIISAHPRMDPLLLSVYFKDRTVIIGRTNELVKKSKFCVAHYSTAINFAALHNKPILFVTTDDIEKCSHMKRCQDAYTNYFKTKGINISNGLDIFGMKDFPIKATNYGNYKNDFIKSDNSVEGEYWATVAGKINSLPD
jgi:hypothetical protein